MEREREGGTGRGRGEKREIEGDRETGMYCVMVLFVSVL